MNTKHLIIFCWTLYGIATIGALIMCAMLFFEKSYSPEMGKGVSKLLAVFFVCLLVVAGLALHWLARSQSAVGLSIMAVLLAWPLVTLAGRVVSPSLAQWYHAREVARIGAFSKPADRALAQAILTDDATTLRSLLRARSLPDAIDRAGLNHLALACFAVADRQASLEPVRALLEAGADPNAVRLPEKTPLIHYLMLNRYRAPNATAAIALLLQYGLDPNPSYSENDDSALAVAGDDLQTVLLLLEHGAEIDRPGLYGRTPLLKFIGERHWESALALVERGARLDIADDSSISVDYYLQQWPSDVYGEQSAGWDRVRAAIVTRRQTELGAR